MNMTIDTVKSYACHYNLTSRCFINLTITNYSPRYTHLEEDLFGVGIPQMQRPVTRRHLSKTEFVPTDANARLCGGCIY